MGHLQPPRQRGHQRASSTWPGTSRSPAAATSQRLLSIRDRSFGSSGDATCATSVAGGAPKFDHRGPRPARRRPARSQDRGGAVLAEQARLHARRPLKLNKRGLPVRTPGNVQQAPFVCVVPNSSATAGPAAAVRPRPVPGRHRGRHDRAARAGVQRGHLRHELHGHVPGGPGQRREGLVTCRASRRSPTACSRGSSPSRSWVGR